MKETPEEKHTRFRINSVYRVCQEETSDRYSNLLAIRRNADTLKKKTENDILNKMGLNQIIHELSSSICNQKWISDDEASEIVAVITHWLQSPSLRVPFLTNSILRECQNFINQPSAPSKKDSLTSCVKEPQSPYQLSLNYIFDYLPYPPPSNYDFTFIDLFAGIEGFE